MRIFPGKTRALPPSAAKTYYDRFGKKQDSQGFYEDPAIDEMTAHAGFQDARRIFEFGCGTGKLAARLLKNHLSSSAIYLGCDISPVMVGIAGRRIATYGRRAQVALSDGAIRFPCADHSVDRVVSTYVLDLLSDSDIRRFFSEARRVLVAGGGLCLASLTRGVGIPSRIVSSLWMIVFRLHPALVGGCRPVRLVSFADRKKWRVLHRQVVTPYGVPSEVLILASKKTPEGGPAPTG